MHKYNTGVIVKNLPSNLKTAAGFWGAPYGISQFLLSPLVPYEQPLQQGLSIV